jgi:hypothetical protein
LVVLGHSGGRGAARVTPRDSLHRGELDHLHKGRERGERGRSLALLKERGKPRRCSVAVGPWCLHVRGYGSGAETQVACGMVARRNVVGDWRKRMTGQVAMAGVLYTWDDKKRA